MSLGDIYTERYQTALLPIASLIEADLRSILKEVPQIDRITARAKSVDRFLKKAEKKLEDGAFKYSNPLLQIQDQIGARIICFYKSDVEPIRNRILEFYRKIEQLDHVLDDVKAFGYEGLHLILKVPEDVVPENIDATERPVFFELQIKTLFQHAWAEAEHDISYKAPIDLSEEQKKLIAYAAAQAWGADRIFDDLFVSITEASANI